MTPRKFNHHLARGFILHDTVMGLILVSTLILVLASAGGYHVRGVRQLAQTRDALYVAEGTLANLRAGLAPGGLPGAVTREIVALDTVSPVAGRCWVRVTAASHGRHATLIGLVPAAAVAAATEAHP